MSRIWEAFLTVLFVIVIIWVALSGFVAGQRNYVMVGYFDQDGNEITVEEWSKLFEDKAYRRVGSTTVHQRWWVSTFWLGINHSLVGLPLYFETMVFDLTVDGAAETAARWPTRVMAKRGHARIVKQIREGRYIPFE